MKARAACAIGLENPLDHDAMEVHVGTEQGAKAVDEGHGADDGWNAVQLKQAGAAVENRLFGLGLDEIYVRTNSSTSQSYLTDALGSVLSLRNPDQSAQADYTHGAYGETTETPPGASSNLIKYTGREQDTAGLYYYRNRYFSSVTDRFLSEDPIALAGGENLYSYVGGNPIGLTDPLGS